MERKPGHFLEHRAFWDETQRQIVTCVAAFANAQRGLKIYVPNRGGTIKMFGRELKPVAGRLLGVEEDQIDGPFPLGQRLSLAKLKKFMRRNDHVPVRLLVERPCLIPVI